jgi:hypothetical protein
VRKLRQERSQRFELQEAKKVVQPLDVWDPKLTREPTPPRQRPVSPAEQVLLSRQVAAWLEQGVIEKRNQRHVLNNNLVFVAKKNGGTRVCDDCTPVNAVTEEQDWNLPRLQDLRHRTKGSNWFTRIDLKDAFFRIRVPPRHRHLTAFSSEGTQYQFKRMPFGVKDGPAVFQRFMETKLATLLWWLVIYIDDLLVHAETLTELRQRTRALTRKLKEMGCEVNTEKSEYEKQSLIFAGIRLFSEGVGPNIEQVQRVLSVPLPTTRADMLSALGLVSYLRDFIPLVSHFTEMMYPSGGVINFTAVNDNWQKLTRHIASAINTLRHWDEHQDADLYADASGKGLGVVLIQNKQIVAVAARKLTPAQTRYSTTDREHMALVYAAEKFKVFLHRHTATTRVHSDHAALIGKRHLHMTPRQERWRSRVSQWMPNVVHVRGVDNPADFFSRWGLEIEGGVEKL